MFISYSNYGGNIIAYVFDYNKIQTKPLCSNSNVLI